LLPELDSELLAVAQSVLTEKEYIGYTLEFIIQQLLSKLKIHLDDANPLNPESWKRETRTRPIDIETDTLRIECKWNNTKVYPAWIWKNILKRFSTSKKRNIVLTNNKTNYYHHPENLEMLQLAEIELWDIKDLEYYLKTPSCISIYNFIKRNVDGIILVSVKSIEYLITYLKSFLNLKNTCSALGIYKLKERLTSDFTHLENDSLNDSIIVERSTMNENLILKTFGLVLLMEQIGKTLLEYLRFHQTDIDQFLEKASKIKTGPMKKVQWKQNSTWFLKRPWSGARPRLNIQLC
jgi:hypothetical protein